MDFAARLEALIDEALTDVPDRATALAEIRSELELKALAIAEGQQHEAANAEAADQTSGGEGGEAANESGTAGNPADAPSTDAPVDPAAAPADAPAAPAADPAPAGDPAPADSTAATAVAAE